MIIRVIDYSEIDENDLPKSTHYSAGSYKEVAELLGKEPEDVAKDISEARARGVSEFAYLKATPWGSIRKKDDDG